MQIFDGHNDLLLNLWLHHHHDPIDAFFNGVAQGHLDYPRMLNGNFAGGLFALFVPPPEYIARVAPTRVNNDFSPSAIIWQQLDILKSLAENSGGRARLCLSISDIEQCLRNNVVAMVAHIEGAECIDNKKNSLQAFYEAGVRSIGPFWNIANRFGEGVKGSFPGSPNTGPGLTTDGINLIKQANALNMLIDVSHMNEKAFWDTARYSTAPLIATHSNAHRLCPQPRNLTDSQLAAISASGGVVGINFGNAFLRPDGQRESDTPLDVIVAHVDYLVAKIGIDHIALGSDFDGVTVPEAIKDVSGLPHLIGALRHNGYSENALAKLAWKNWLQMLRAVWEK